jgi:hypothetical protein
LPGASDFRGYVYGSLVDGIVKCAKKNMGSVPHFSSDSGLFTGKEGEWRLPVGGKSTGSPASKTNVEPE